MENKKGSHFLLKRVLMRIACSYHSIRGRAEFELILELSNEHFPNMMLF